MSYPVLLTPTPIAVSEASDPDWRAVTTPWSSLLERHSPLVSDLGGRGQDGWWVVMPEHIKETGGVPLLCRSSRLHASLAIVKLAVLLLQTHL